MGFSDSQEGWTESRQSVNKGSKWRMEGLPLVTPLPTPPQPLPSPRQVPTPDPPSPSTALVTLPSDQAKPQG